MLHRLLLHDPDIAEDDRVVVVLQKQRSRFFVVLATAGGWLFQHTFVVNDDSVEADCGDAGGRPLAFFVKLRRREFDVVRLPGKRRQARMALPGIFQRSAQQRTSQAWLRLFL